jgi:BirA family transcriptional regulator, biotin operon repressor / biotin---[acetyl-CoA-carboxylase] ligase
VNAAAPIEVLPEIDSTNAEVLRRIAKGRTDPHWVLALSQTKGRGRRARGWESPPGNLFATLLLPLEVEPHEAATLSFVTALAVMDVLDRLAGPERVTLKWPNDVMVAGKKAVGILLESDWSRDDRLMMAVGVGINLVHAPIAPERPAIALADLGLVPPPPEEVANQLAGAFAERFGQWRDQGFAATRTAWLSRAQGLGGPVVARLTLRTHEGVFEDLDDTGGLVLRDADGKRRLITAADVFFPDGEAV